ncbi:Phage tail protein [Camponotus japonicus]
MVISMLASIATVQCGTIVAPVVGKLVSEKVVESHGNNVVHASAAPLVAAASPALLRYATNVAVVQEPVAEIVQPLAKASLVAEKTVEAHGHHIIHNAHPLVAVAAKPLAAIESHIAIPAIAARGLAAPTIYYSTFPHQLIAEKTVSSYGHSIQHVA